MTTAYPSLLSDSSTTFKRFLLASYESECLIKHPIERVINFNRGVNSSLNYSTGIITENSAFTNFKIVDISIQSDTINSFLTEDFDFYMPLKPKNSFKVKAHIKSITKFSPKPYFD